MDEKEFSVVISDLKNATSVFHNSSLSYQAQVPNGGRFLRASGGDPQLDKIIDVSLGIIEEMHTILVQALDQHSQKLGLMADSYDDAEKSGEIRHLNLAKDLQQLFRAPDDPPPLNKPPSF